VRGLYGWWVPDKEGDDAIPGMPMTPKEFFKFCNDTGSAGKTSAMLRQAQSYLMVEIDAFDRDPLALNCLNGTVKMRWDGRGARPVRRALADHDPADRITRCCSVAYDPAGRRPAVRAWWRSRCRTRDERATTTSMGYGSTGCTTSRRSSSTRARGATASRRCWTPAARRWAATAWRPAPDTFLEGGMRSAATPRPT
jgi:putative DNA primase/helicase